MPRPFKKKAPRSPGLNPVIEEGVMEFLSLDLLSLGKGGSFEYSTGGSEVAVVPMKATVRVETGGESYMLERSGVFSENASALCLPRDTKAVFHAAADSELALCKARTKTKGKTIFVPKEGVKEKTVGRNNWERKVVDIIDPSVKAERLVLGETFNAPGSWSSFPPHKHDTYSPGVEAKMEEIYLFRLDPAEGFGTQTVYGGGESDYSFKVEDYDAVTIPWGYHPVSAMPGYRLYYLWFLAGEGRTLMPKTDPRYKWLE
ncbi:MAG: 5-deoxy-glucuronate isomerase [Deltaproteobacteria bacterium]|nr:5-deoxy-glucuronate isomerase [Deltaproteobacteria bacterium]